MDVTLDWHDNLPPHIETFAYSTKSEKDLNFEQSGYVYTRQANCTKCRKDLVMMTFRFEVIKEEVNVMHYNYLLIAIVLRSIAEKAN